MTYSEKLKNPKWQKKRLEILQYANWKCQLCGDGNSPLNVHHSYYTKGKQPWQYPNGSMIALCEKHHAWFEELRKQENRAALYTPPPPPPEPVKDDRPRYDLETWWGKLCQSVWDDRPLVACWFEVCRLEAHENLDEVSLFVPKSEECSYDILRRPQTLEVVQGHVSRAIGRPITLKVLWEVEDGHQN